MKMNYSGWYVLYVKSQHEKKIDTILKDLEIESFLPTITTMRQWADRKKKVIKPLFPSYVFLNIHSKNEFNEALNVNGVFKFISFGGKYAKVSNDEINRIKQFLNIEGISEVVVENGLPLIGELMTINCGPLNGLECKVVRNNTKNKVFVSIESLRQNITAIVPSNYLSLKCQGQK